MPYYVYKINQGPAQFVKNLDLINEFESFQDAQKFAKQTRADQSADDEATIKVMFAKTQLEAEEQLMETREKPILREWEK